MCRCKMIKSIPVEASLVPSAKSLLLLSVFHVFDTLIFLNNRNWVFVFFGIGRECLTLSKH